MIPYPRKKKQQAIVTNHKTEWFIDPGGREISLFYAADYSFLENALLLSSFISLCFRSFLVLFRFFHEALHGRDQLESDLIFRGLFTVPRDGAKEVFESLLTPGARQVEVQGWVRGDALRVVE